MYFVQRTHKALTIVVSQFPAAYVQATDLELLLEVHKQFSWAWYTMIFQNTSFVNRGTDITTFRLCDTACPCNSTSVVTRYAWCYKMCWYYVGIRWTWTSDHSSWIQAQQRNVNIIIIINKIVSVTDWSSSWSVQNVLDISLNSFMSIIPSHSLTSPLCLWPIIPRPATDLRKLISSTPIILFHPHPHPVNVWHSDPHKIICTPLLHCRRLLLASCN